MTNRASEAVEEVLFADGAEFAVAEEAAQAHGPELLLDHLGIVVAVAEEAAAAPVATAQAAAKELMSKILSWHSRADVRSDRHPGPPV